MCFTPSNQISKDVTVGDIANIPVPSANVQSESVLFGNPVGSDRAVSILLSNEPVGPVVP